MQRFGTFSFGVGKITPGVKWILISTVCIFIIQIIAGTIAGDPGLSPYPNLYDPTIHNPFSVLFMLKFGGFSGFYPWQIVTYMFLHSGFMHIIFNMFGVWMFGVPYERQFGTKNFLLLYFISGVGTGVFLILTLSNVLGASAAVFAVLVSFAYMWPQAIIYIWGILPVKAWVFILIFIGIELLLTISQKNSNVAHSAHVIGAFIGLIFLQIVHKKYQIFGSVSQYIDEKKEQRHHRSQKQEVEKIVQKEEWVQEKVDSLLEKVSKQGINSLTKKEKEFLDRVSMNYSSRSRRDEF